MAVIQETVRYPFAAFQDRRDAGRRLAEFIGARPDPAALVLGVPRGGVPVAQQLAAALDAPLDLVFTRKLPLPDSPEAGFGAVALDGTVVLNEAMVREWGLPRDLIDRIVREVTAELRRRAGEYALTRPASAIRGKHVYLVDDGLATGYTMIAAATMVRNQSPQRLVLAVPVSPAGSIRAVEPHVDELFCLISQQHPPFAVASFYEEFSDLSDAEVRTILSRQPARRAPDK